MTTKRITRPLLRVLPATLLGLAGAAALAQKDSAAAASYHLIRKISLPGDEGWDYIAADSRDHRLYVSRGTHVAVVDTAEGKPIGDIPDTAGVHGIAIDHRSGRGFTSNGRSNSVTIFDLKTLKKIDEVKVGEGPDCIAFEPVTRRVFTFNGRGKSATAIDAATGKVAGTVSLPGRPEFAVADGKGHLFNNIEDKNEIADVNAQTLAVDHVWPIAPGEGPSGIAMDRRGRRLFSVCDGKKMVVTDADSGRIVATPTIGTGPDACAYDPGTHLVFSPNGRDGTITIVRQVSPDTYEEAQTVKTQAGARTMALDERTHHIFTVTATMLPAEPGAGGGQPGRFRRFAPGSFVILELGPE